MILSKTKTYSKEQLRQAKRESKHLMFIKSPTKGDMGSQYWFWQEQWELAKEKLKELGFKR